MKPILPIVLAVLCLPAAAQNPPAQAPAPQNPPVALPQLPPSPGQLPPALERGSKGTQNLNPVPKPGEQPVPNALGLVQQVSLTVDTAIQRAQIYSQQIYSASFAALLAHEDAVQAKAALLPTAQHFTQYIYTQGNGTPSGVFVANDGVHVYNEQMIVHGDIYNPAKLADYRRALAAEALAKARSDLAARGLIVTVTQNYYGMVAAQRKTANARQSMDEAQQFLDITRKLEQGGEAAHVDVIKAQIQVQQRERELMDAEATYEKARIGLGILVFPSYGQTYSVTDDLETTVTLPSFDRVQALAKFNNPEIRVAKAMLEQQNHVLSVARAAYLPSLSMDYFYGIDANQFATHDPEGHNRLGSVVQGQLTVPVWNWFSTRSKVRAAEFQVRQSRADLSLAQRTVLSEIESFYLEAQTAAAQLASLRSSVDLSVENLRLTRLRYTAGEATAQEVVDAQSGLVQARNAQDDGMVRHRVALANLQTLTGRF
jgi:outer membrane protein TolC